MRSSVFGPYPKLSSKRRPESSLAHGESAPKPWNKSNSGRWTGLYEIVRRTHPWIDLRIFMREVSYGVLERGRKLSNIPVLANFGGQPLGCCAPQLLQRQSLS